MANTIESAPMSATESAEMQPHFSASEPRLTPERLALENRRHDRILAGLVVVLAFLLASYPVTNADLWMHLRVGQMIADGGYLFGQDSFSFATKDAGPWVHAGWLFDVTLYGIYAFVGRCVGESAQMKVFGAALVLLRGLIAVGLTLLFLKIRKSEKSLFPVAVAAALTILVISQSMLLRSDLVTFLFLGLTLYLVQRKPMEISNGESTPSQRQWFLLVPLFALWANMDQLFFLGPIVVALYLVGHLIQNSISASKVREDGLKTEESSRLALVLVLGVAACLLNPFHVKVFQLPGEWVSATVDALRSAEGIARQGISPFEAAFFRRGDGFWLRPSGLTLADWGYYLLILLSLISFLVNLQRGRWWRFLVWIGFFFLSAWQARNIGLFAVVAGPIMGLNFQDALAAEPHLQRSSVFFGQLGRVFVVLFVLLLGSLMCLRGRESPVGNEGPTGFVHIRGGLGWSASVDPSLKKSAEQLGRWRIANRLPGQAMHLSWMDLPSYWSWFAPSLQGFMDFRYALFGPVVDDYLQAHQALRNTRSRNANDFHWKDIFKKYDISHVVLTAADKVPQEISSGREVRTINVPLSEVLLNDRTQWELLNYLDGRTFVFAWKDSPHYAELKSLRYDAERAAFRDPLPISSAIDPTNNDHRLVSWLAGESNRRPLAFEEADWHFQRYQIELNRWQGSLGPFNLLLRTLPAIWHFPSLTIGGFPLPFTVGGVPAPLLVRMNSVTGGSLYLALRAVRRALAENPNHADSHRLLFEVYRALANFEQTNGGITTGVRETQELAALYRATAILDSEAADPRVHGTLVELHQQLARLYVRRNLLDLAVDHTHAVIRLIRQAKPAAGVTPEVFEREIQTLARDLLGAPLEQAQTALRDSEAAYRSAFRPNPLERAQLALNARLGVYARHDLEEALRTPMNPGQTNQAFQQLLDLYLQMGAVREAQAMMLRPDAVERLGVFRYDIFASLIASAEGNLGRVTAHRKSMEEARRQSSLERALTGLKLHTLGGNAESPGSSLIGVRVLNQSFGSARQRAEEYFFLGVIALEEGHAQQAADYFRKIVQEISDQTPYRVMAGRYHYLITGKGLEEK